MKTVFLFSSNTHNLNCDGVIENIGSNTYIHQFNTWQPAMHEKGMTHGDSDE